MEKEHQSGGLLFLRDIKQLEGFDINPNHILNTKYIFNNKQLIDYEWIEKQMHYIDNLSDRQRHIIRAYTIYGDRFVNYYLRNMLTDRIIYNLLEECIKNNENPFLYQHRDKTGMDNIDNIYKSNIYIYIITFINEFTDIIKNAPRLTKTIKVFRGVRNGEFIVKSLQENKQNGQQFMKNTEFISTTIYLPSIINFMKGDCCLLELYIEPTTPCLFTAHNSRRRNEFEITLIPETIMKYIKYTKKILVDESEYYNDYSIFIYPVEKGAKTVRICEFTVFAK